MHLSSATLRDAPHVMGLGYIEMVARQLESDLEFQLDFHRNQAFFSTDEPYIGALVVDDLDFGAILFFQDGSEDFSFVRGVSEDLKVRPFGHKGRHRFLTDTADEAFAVHHSHQSTAREERYAVPVDDEEPSAVSDARRLSFLGPGPAGDRDEDGVFDELSTGQASLLATYMSLLATPTLRPPKDAAMALVWAKGRVQFDEVGCTSCHREKLRLQSFDLYLRSERGLHPSTFIPVLDEGMEPKPSRNDFSDEELGVPLFAYADLRRHDLGQALADESDEFLPDGSGKVAAREWLTRSLWGLADTGPYLHDGRALTVHDAIVAHGGEAREAAEAYSALSDDDQAALRGFLQGLSREPLMLVE
ncbi:MAG: hypothetical protein GY822_11865 [Deltaproteobacteria bacterium]|nr:hypothetical protein [Deltaproteobacteria bacterium]